MRSTAFLAAAAALAVLAAPARAQSPAPPLRASINSDIRSTQPGVNRDFNTDAVVLHVVEGLVALDERAAPVPMLAEKVDLSPDGLTYTFTLRQGVTFHNGEPLTSADVLWTLRRDMDPAAQWRCLSDFNGAAGLVKIRDIAAPDPRTVVITLAKPERLLLSLMARPECGGTGIVHPSSVGADGSWIKPVGTGPYRIAQWRRGEYVDLERFDQYASLPGKPDGYAGGKRALIPRVRFVVIPDSAAAKTALLSGNIDVVTDVSTEDVPELRTTKGVTVESAPTMGLVALLIQTRDPLLQDVRIRRALALALDCAEVVSGVVGQDAPDNPSILPATSPFYTTAQSHRPARDLAAAKRLLAEAGYRGQKIRLVTNHRYADTYDTAVAAQAMALEAGINIELDVLDWATELDRYSRGDYQLMSFIYSARLDPSLSYDTVIGPKDLQPRKVWDDPKAIALLQRSMTVADRPEQQSIFDQLFAMSIEQVPLIPLYNQPDYMASRSNVHGLVPWSSGQARLWGVWRD